jgi:hypothetical protein
MFIFPMLADRPVDDGPFGALKAMDLPAMDLGPLGAFEGPAFGALDRASALFSMAPPPFFQASGGAGADNEMCVEAAAWVALSLFGVCAESIAIELE